MFVLEVFLTALGFLLLNVTPTWDKLRGLGRNRVIRSSYFWFVVVPIAANLMQPVPPELSVSLFGAHFSIATTLPFSWKLLFFAALFFALASLLFSWRCPTIINRYESYRGFREAEHSGIELIAYTDEFFSRSHHSPYGWLGIFFMPDPHSSTYTRIKYIHDSYVVNKPEVEQYAQANLKRVMTERGIQEGDRRYKAERNRRWWLAIMLLGRLDDGMSPTIFDHMKHETKNLDLATRMLCTFLYAGGFLLVLVIALRSTWFVVRYIATH